MATPTAAQRAQIVELYVAYFNRAPEAAGLEFWAQKFADLTVAEEGDAEAALKTVANGMWDAAEGEVGYDEATDTSTFLDMVYQNVLGRAPDAEGKAFWALAIDEGRVTLGDFILEFIGGITEAGDPAGYERFNARNEVAAEWSKPIYSADLSDADARAQGTAVIEGINTEAQAQAKIEQLVGGLAGETFRLTTGFDDLVGTSGNDTFIARVLDNSNTLQSGDVIDGAGGTNNKLIADLGSSSNFAITPETVRVQTIELRAQSKARDSGDNNTIENGGQQVEETADARIDAERSIGVKEWINNQSRADLVIEDVRVDAVNDNRPSDVTAVTQITKDITLTMRGTDAGAVDFRVYFEANSLIAAPQTREGAQLNLELMDTRSAVAQLDPLLNSPFNGFTFGLDGNIIRVQSEAIGTATTYAQLLSAVQDAVAAIPALRDFVVAFGNDFSAIDTESGISATGRTITLTNNGSGVVTPGNYLTPDGSVPGSSGLHLEQNNEAPLVIDQLVTSKIILDDVGRGATSDAYKPGSAAGDFVVGSMATIGGVERFEVEVQRGSWINSLSSTNNALQEVSFVNGNSPVVGSHATGYVHIGASLQENSDYNNLTGWQPVTEKGTLLGTNGLTDVRLIDAATFEGDMKIGAAITRETFDKYLDVIDPDTGLANADDVNFSYNLGSGDDTLNLAVDKFVTGDVDFSLDINTGAGNDVVNVTIVELNGAAAQFGNWLGNQADLKNISINTGAGNDWVYTNGRGNYEINTGTGDDTVYVDNSGDKAVFILNARSTSFADLAIEVTAAQGAKPLNNDVASAPAVTYTGVNGTVTVGFKGLVSQTVDIAFTTTGTGRTTDLSVNQAIKDAINNDSVLSKLLVAKDGPNRSLIVESLIDGVIDPVNDLIIDFDTTALTTAQTTAGLVLFDAAAADLAYVEQYAFEGTAVGTLAVTTAADAAVAEVQTLTLSATDLAGLNDGAFLLRYDGVDYTVAVTGITPASTVADKLTALATGIDTALTGQAGAAVAGGVILITNDTVANPTGTASLASGQLATGSDSVAHSDNVIDAGAGQDVIVLGTNTVESDAALIGSNDTVKFTAESGVNLTIVDFVVGTDTTAGVDFLDFTSYLGANSTGFNNGAFAGTTATGEVTLVTFNAGWDTLPTVDPITFEELTAAQFMGVLNGANGTNATTLTATKSVFLVQDGVDNVFKVFAAESLANNGDFTTVKLIGTVDMADTDVNNLTADNFI